MKLVIIGGVAGGASAAARARRVSEQAEIVMFERGPFVSFANCGLPYHIGEVIPNRDKLLVTTPERLRERFRLDVRTNSEVTAIDRVRKVVAVRDRLSKTSYEQPYDKLILAPGAAPIRPSIPGHDLPNVFTLRDLGDMDRIKSVVDAGVRNAIIVGGGFIGLELAENLIHRGIATTIVNLSSQIMAPFDAEMTTPLLKKLHEKHVSVILNQTVEAISSSADGMTVTLTSGEQQHAQLVVFGVGVRPENLLAKMANLEIGPRGGIRVNPFLQTSDPDIYAVGDVIETNDSISGERTQIPLAGPANRQGRIAADNALGRSSTYRGTQGTAIIGLFGMTAAMTGHSEKVLKQLNTPYRKIYVHPANHASYYPGAEGMTLKLLFHPETGRVLGAQGIGGDGVDKRIDVLSVAIQAQLTVNDLEEMELCYAPQFSSAKDPVNMAGFVAAGMLRGDHPQIDWEVYSQSHNQFQIIDVRTPQEFQQGAIPNAINIPVDEMRNRLDDLSKSQRIVVYCQVGQRGYLATRLLMQFGYDVRNLSGGYKTFLLYNPA